MRNTNLTRWLVAVGATAATLLAGTACSSTPDTSAIPSAGALAAGLQDKLTSLAGGNQALAALGQLGQDNGASDQVKQLGAKLLSDNQGLVDQLKQAGTAVGATVPDGVGADVQATIDDLKTKTGTEFDQAWLQAVQTTQQSTEAAATDLAGTEGVPSQLAQVAQSAAQQLTAEQQATQQASTEIGGAAAAGQTSTDAQAGGTAGESGAAAGSGSASGSGSTSGSGSASGTAAAGTPTAGSPYTVQRGDTLSSIAQRAYGNPADEQKIGAANNLGNHDLILPGQVLNLP